MSNPPSLTQLGSTVDAEAPMISLSGGTFPMGSDCFYPDETPRRRASVGAFAMDTFPVTNRRFAAFVAATGYRTLAEEAPDISTYPGMDPALVRPGSIVFTPPSHIVDLDDITQWWTLVPGADWRHPTGSDSGIAGLGDHPVVHVALRDALAFASWAGKSLPTECEWEYAARGGLNGEYAWGDELAPAGAILANYWHGLFPVANITPDGWKRTSPVGSYPLNPFGLSDMIGNVWEWTASVYDDRGAARPSKKCCLASTAADAKRNARHVVKGGSHLCAPNYCQRYRPAARMGQPGDTATSHVGFRCVRHTVMSPRNTRRGRR